MYVYYYYSTQRYIFFFITKELYDLQNLCVNRISSTHRDTARDVIAKAAPGYLSCIDSTLSCASFSGTSY